MEKRWDELFIFLCMDVYPSGYTKAQRLNLRRHSAKFSIKEGELFFGNRRAIKTKEEARMLFMEFHCSPSGTHLGIVKTRFAMCSRFYWHGMTIDVDKWVTECDQCKNFGKTLTASEPLESKKKMAVRRLMRAVQVFEFGEPDVLKFHEDVPVPIPGKNQVLIKVHACGINPVETYIRAGIYARKPSLPYIPGSDVSGIIEKLGKDVTSFKKGDRVFATSTVTGGYADYTISSVDTVYPLPEQLSFKQGAAISVPYFTAYRALFQKAHGKPGETVLVHGASGGVGIAACQIARAYGLTVFGTAGTNDGLHLVLQNGAHQVFNHRENDYIQKIQEATGGQGVNVILEMLANVNLSNDLPLLSVGGRVVIIGSRGPIEINPRDTMAKESSIIGVSLFGATEEDRKETAAALFSGMEAGWLKPLIGPEYSLENAAQAHVDIIQTGGATGKMIFVI